MKILFLLIDGLADVEKSPLKEAKKPNLDFLAKNGICGLLNNDVEGKDFSVSATLNILGYREHPSRGYIEAVGSGFDPKDGEICLRCNFAAVDDKMDVLDRRAGRDESGLEEMAIELDKIKIKGCNIQFKKSSGHRGVLVISGKGLSENVSGTDPYEEGESVQESKPLIPKSAKDHEAAMKTAKIINEFTKQSYEILNKSKYNKEREVPANIVLCRYPGIKSKVESFKKKHGMEASSIAAVGSINGIGKILGMRTLKAGNGLTDTNLKEKLERSLEELKKSDFVLLHIKGCDVASHDKKPLEKKAFIERIDREVVSKISGIKDTLLIITTDHITSSKDGQHKNGYVPVLFYKEGMGPDKIKFFDEESVKTGSLGIIDASNLMEKVLEFSS